MSTDAYRLYKRWATEPLTETPRISVVIPAYNEAERLMPTLGAVAAHMSARDEPWELLVSDDGSTDETARLVEELRLPNLRLLRAPANGGKGRAVRRGVLAARGEYVLFADADQSTPIEQFDTLLARVTQGGCAVAVGSRAAAGAQVSAKSAPRRFLSWGLRVLVRSAFGVGVRDTQCGFKLFRRDAARQLFALQRLDGFSFDLELLYLCHRLGLEVAEVPVRWIDAPGSTVDGVRATAGFLVDLVAIRLADLRGTYRGGAVPLAPPATTS